MTVHKAELDDGLIRLRVRVADDAGPRDVTIVVRPGESALGRSFRRWARLPDGPHAVERRHPRDYPRRLFRPGHPPPNLGPPEPRPPIADLDNPTDEELVRDMAWIICNFDRIQARGCECYIDD